MTWQIWDKQSSINTLSAADFMAKNKHLIGETDILIKFAGNQIIQVEGKNILAQIYGLDSSLPLEEFIDQYEKKLFEAAVEVDSVESFDPYNL